MTVDQKKGETGSLKVFATGIQTMKEAHSINSIVLSILKILSG